MLRPQLSVMPMTVTDAPESFAVQINNWSQLPIHSAQTLHKVLLESQSPFFFLQIWIESEWARSSERLEEVAEIARQ